MNARIFVEKKPGYQTEALSLLDNFKTNLKAEITSLRLINVYDVFNIKEEVLEKAKYSIFGEIVTDNVFDTLDLTGKKYIAMEYLPGQFDQRASSAIDCCKLVNPNADINIRSGKILILDDDISDENLERVKKYVINQVESREKDLTKLSDMEKATVNPVKVLDGFIKLT